MALALLLVDFVLYFVLFTVRQYQSVEFPYLQYNSIIDLVLQLLLGFGMVIVLLELVLADAEVANKKLREAHEKLEEIAHVDPLTTALNRHAFHGYLKKHGGENGPANGCVGFFDIDDLKIVNDVYGHAAGDLVIRAVVRAIRDIIRGEDLIFRWGGDEFFVLMVGLDASMAETRIQRMHDLLSSVPIDGIPQPLAIGVSHAFADFRSLGELEETISRADEGMYRQKQIRKAATSGLIDVSSLEMLTHV